MKFRTLVCLVGVLCLGIVLDAQDSFFLKSGASTIDLQTATLQSIGVRVDLIRNTDSVGGSHGSGFIILNSKKTPFLLSQNQVLTNPPVLIPAVGGIVFSNQAHVLKLIDFIIKVGQGGKGMLVLPGSPDRSMFDFSATGLSYSPERSSVILTATNLTLSPDGAAVLGVPDKAGTIFGTFSFEGTVTKSASASKAPPNLGQTNGADLSFCQLDSLSQFGREGDIVGLSFSTTSWNIGNTRLDWYRFPQWRHPFIARNFYRLSDSKIEQIGEGAVKHGFFALSLNQCGGTCDATDGSQLGVNCTDTYNAQTSADQRSLGPRYEINPWDGFYNPDTSHLAANPHPAHDHVTHLLRVHDHDLNTNDNYIVEGYYVQYQDTNPMNSAAWKMVKVVGGGPGDTWIFQMDDDAAPNIGFAIDAWPSASKTVFAEETPVLKGKSPDGRSILAVKSQQLQNGMWRYEYAILNVDMDRQIGSLEIPLPQNATITDVTFHSPVHDGEDFSAVGGVRTNNADWSSETKPGSIAWKTTTNPLRWGTLYNFGFSTTIGPSDTTVEVGLFKSGSPSSLKVSTKGPAVP